VDNSGTLGSVLGNLTRAAPSVARMRLLPRPISATGVLAR
jgi:hypothetical protein